MKVLSTIWLLLFTVYFFIAPLEHLQAQSAADSIPAKLDAYLVAANKAYKFNGSALVAKSGKVLLHKAYGYKDYTARTLNDTATRFPILSITKSFTAMVMLKLQEEGKLSLNDKVSKYFPELTNGEQIKLHHLLTHSSGLYNYTSDIDEGDSLIVCYPVAKQRVVDIFKDKPLEFTPGKNITYNNSGFFLAGMVIEKVTGKAYEQVVKEKIFEPLGMQASGFDFSHLPAQSRATGYQFLNDEVQKRYPQLDSTVAYAAGAIYSTTGDMYKWAKAISSKQLLSDDSWKLAYNKQLGDYTYGFKLGYYAGKKYIKATGGYPGFMSEFVYYPDEDLTIILLNNYGDYSDNIWSLGMGLTNIGLQKPYDMWVSRKEVKLPENVLSQYTGNFGSKKSAVRFVMRDGRLFCTLPNAGEFPLLAESETNYYVKNFTTQFHFVKNANGQVDKLLIHEHGQKHELPKLE
jgi:CubicO group peptidase (beta-lactamase class C family)